LNLIEIIIGYLNNALRHASGDIVVITDADSRWNSERTLSNAVAWLSDPTVGAVTCVKNPERGGFLGVEGGYRGFYNTGIPWGAGSL
jgi:biofilm PGA synthesis N-glycosyltransferase PgaC